jgi:RHS repeat-associated protein
LRRLIINWKDNYGFLTSGIALQYSSGNGLQVNDIASNVGQGWNLMAGGSITRMQVGEPDDQKPYLETTPETYSDIKKYPAGYLYATINPGLGVSGSLNQYPIFGARNILYKQHNDVAADKELDIFSFSFNGKGGRFILDKNTSQGVCLENQRIKIWYDRNENNAVKNIRTTIVAFYLQDESGTIYKFNKYLTAKVLKPQYCNGTNLTTILQQPNFKHGNVYHQSSFEDANIKNPNVINEWQLTEVEDGFTHRKIYYNYNIVRDITITSGTSIATYDESKNLAIGGIIAKVYSVISHQVSKTQVSDLANIVYPDGHEVVFGYGDNRVDLNGAVPLKTVDVKYQGRFISRHELQTTYFLGNFRGTPSPTSSEDQKRKARLCLQSVKHIGPDLKMDDNPYEFEYYMGSSAPGDVIPAPFTHLKDIWGYYNGDQSADFNNTIIPLDKKLSDLTFSQVYGLCYRRSGSIAIKLNPKSGYAKNGLLKQVIYPTGGTISYEYEQNESVLPGGSVNTMVGGVHVSKTLVADGGFSNGCGANALVTNYNFKQSGGSLSSLYTLEVPDNKIVTSSYYQKAGKYFKLLSLKCKYKFQYPGVLSREQMVDLTSMQKFMESGAMDYLGTNTSAYASMLSSAGKKVGPNVLLKVMSGDNISGEAPYYYANPVTNSSGANNLVGSVLTTLINAITGSAATNSVTKGASGNINTTLTGNVPFGTATGPDASNASGNMPKAYFTILFFDERFNFIEENSTSRRVATAGDGATALTLANIKAPKNGYAYIYVSNESAEPVYFDNIQVTHEHKQIIEEDHYYSYGLKIAAISSRKLGDPNEGQLRNNYLYQGDYSEYDEDIAWNDYPLRNYDSQIGRFVNADPYNQFANPYTGIGNDPVNLIDPSGGWASTGLFEGLSNFGKIAVTTFGGAIIGGAIDLLSGGDGGKGLLIGAGVGLASNFISSFDWSYLLIGSSELNFFVTGTAKNPAMKEYLGFNAPNMDLAWARMKSFFSFGKLKIIRAIDGADAATQILKKLGDNKTIGSMLVESHAHMIDDEDRNPLTTSIAIGDDDKGRINASTNISENIFFRSLAPKTTVNTKVFLGNCWSGASSFQPVLQHISAAWHGASVFGQASDNRTMSLFNHNSFTQPSYIKSKEAAWFQRGGRASYKKPQQFPPYDEWGGVGKYYKSVGGGVAEPTAPVSFGSGATIIQ